MRVACTPRSPLSFSCTSSAMRCAVKRKSAADTTRFWPKSTSPLTTSHNLKRTSKRPSARRLMEPATTASVPRVRQSAATMLARSSSCTGRLPGASVGANRPLRCKSARTTAAKATGARSSPRKLAITTGICRAPTPEISMRNCASAGAAGAQAKAQMSRRRGQSSLFMGRVE